MTPEQISGLSLALLVMGVGLLGSVLPLLPGPPIVLVAAIAHRLYFGETSAGNFVLILMTALTAFALVVDFIATMIGSRKLGATWRGVIGAILGGIVGLFFGLPGIVLGPFLGAVLLELLGGREFGAAAKAGLGALLGLIGGALTRLACCAAMIAMFTVDVIQRSQDPAPPAAETIAAIGGLRTR